MTAVISQCSQSAVCWELCTEPLVRSSGDARGLDEPTDR